jgi:hypothetical protein
MERGHIRLNRLSATGRKRGFTLVLGFGSSIGSASITFALRITFLDRASVRSNIEAKSLPSIIAAATNLGLS